MADLVSRLLAVVLLRLGPQDLPAGTTPMVLAIVLYIGTAGLSMSVGRTPENPVAVLTLAVLLPLLLVRIVLALTRKPERISQTLTALFGTSAILTVANLPLAAAAADGEPTLLVALLSLVFFVWSFVVDAHIWRNALDVRFSTGLAVAVGLFAVTLWTITTLAGPL